jgi:hypothetical protein
MLEGKEPGTPDVLGEVINHTETHYWVRTVSDGPIDEDTCNKLETALGRHFAFISPVYRSPSMTGRGGCCSPLANIILIKLPDFREGQQMRPAQVVERLGLKEIVEKSRYLGAYRYFVVANPRKDHVFPAAREAAR